MLPDFLIIGAARSGTTWIANNLMEHPEIYLPHEKELHFFDRDYWKGIDFYERYFSGRSEKKLGEATPAYLYFPQIPALIKKHIPDVKLIASLRNPADRAYSHYWNLVASEKDKTGYPKNGFEDALNATRRLINEGYYHDMLLRYYQIFPKENILVLIYEELKKNPTNFLKEIFSFLDITPDFIPTLLNQKLNTTVANMGKYRILYYMHKILLKRLKLFKIARFVEVLNTKRLPEMKENTRIELKKVFAAQVEMLENLIEKDLTLWK